MNKYVHKKAEKMQISIYIRMQKYLYIIKIINYKRINLNFAQGKRKKGENNFQFIRYVF